MIADPAGRVTYFDLPCPLLSVSYPMDLTPGSTVGHTLSNGATRIVPGTQRTNDLDRMPELQDEPRWMKMSTVAPVPAGSCCIRDQRAWQCVHPAACTLVRSSAPDSAWVVAQRGHPQPL